MMAAELFAEKISVSAHDFCTKLCTLFQPKKHLKIRCETAKQKTVSVSCLSFVLNYKLKTISGEASDSGSSDPSWLLGHRLSYRLVN